MQTNNDKLQELGYELLTTFANETFSEAEEEEYDHVEEAPAMCICVKTAFLEKYIREEVGYEGTVQSFLGEYTYEDVCGMANDALDHDGCAFVHRMGFEDREYIFPEHPTADDMTALRLYIEGDVLAFLAKSIHKHTSEAPNRSYFVDDDGGVLRVRYEEDVEGIKALIECASGRSVRSLRDESVSFPQHPFVVGQ